MAGEQPTPSLTDIRPAIKATPGQNGSKPETVPALTPSPAESTLPPDNSTQEKPAAGLDPVTAPEPISPNLEVLQQIRDKIGEIPEGSTVDSLMEILGWNKDSVPLVEGALEALKAEQLGQTAAEKMEGDTPDQATSGTATHVGDEDAAQKDTKETQTEKESQAETEDREESEPEVEETSDETEQPQEPEIPLSEKVDNAWKGEDGIVTLVSTAIDEGRFSFNENEPEEKCRQVIAAELGISDPTDLGVYKEYEFRQNLHKALKDLKTEGKRNEDGSVSVEDEDGNIRLIRSEDCIEPILSAGKRLAAETVTDAQGQEISGERANKAQAALSVLEKVKKTHLDGGYYFDTEEEKKEPPEPPEKTLLRLRKMVNGALQFLSQPENKDSEDGEKAKEAMDAYGQLVLVSETEIKEGVFDPIGNSPPEVRLLLTRQALSKYQEFRKKIMGKGKKAEDAYDDWQEVQNEADKKNEGIDTTIDYLKKFVTENKKGKWDERIDELIKDGHLNEAVTAVFTASYFGKTKDRQKALNQSPALKKSGLANEFGKKNSPWISNFMEAFFGNLARQEEKKKILKEILGRLPLNKWKMAAETVGGMLFVAALGKIDELMSAGVEPAQQGPAGPR